MASTQTAPPDLVIQPAPDRRRWFALAVVMGAAFMELVDATIVNVAIPSIQRDLGASDEAIQWITGGFALAFALGLITGGRLGDIYGRKRIFLLGITSFTVASGLCGLAASPDLLIATRVLQGAAGSLLIPQVLSIINVTFDEKERGKVFGMYGAMIGMGAIAGPVLGALLTQWNMFGLEWRPIFLVNLPIGAAGLVFGLRFIMESKSPTARRLDPVGILLAACAMVMVLFPVTQGRALGWPTWIFVMAAAGLAVFALFIRYERYKTNKDGSPLVELSLFKIKSFAAGVAVQSMFGIATGIFFLTWTLYLQNGLGWSALRSGLTAVPFSIGVGVAAAVAAPMLVPKFGRKVIQAGAVVMISGALAYLGEVYLLAGDITCWEMVPVLVTMGLGMGLIITPLTDSILSQVPGDHSGSASGLISTTQQAGWALGLGFLSVAFFPYTDHPSPQMHGRAEIFGDAFGHSLLWVVAALTLLLGLMFLLPPRVRKDG